MGWKCNFYDAGKGRVIMTELLELDPLSNHWTRLSMALPLGGVQACFKTETACISRMRKVRWPEGVKCPGCGSASIGRIKTRKNYQCCVCRRQFSVTTDTICHRTHLGLMTWFIGAETMIAAHAKGRAQDLLTSERLSGKLGVTYKVAYQLRKKLRADLLQQGGGLLGHCICVSPSAI